MKKLVRTEFALDNIKSHISGGSCQGINPIESYLVQYLAVIFISEMEEMVATIIRNRLACHGDQKLGCFIASTNDQMIRRTSKSDISKMLKLFGVSVNDEFNGIIQASEVSYYSNIIEARHKTAHESGFNITLIDFEKGVSAALNILDAIEKVIK